MDQYRTMEHPSRTERRTEMSEAPERLWAWSFNTWDQWGGYARPNNRHPIGDKERETGAEYIRADLAIPTDDAIRKAAFDIAVLMQVHADIGTTPKAKADVIERGIRDLIYKPGKETSHE